MTFVHPFRGALTGVVVLVVSASHIGALRAGPADPPSGTPLAVVDLATDAGARLVQGTWRYSDAAIVEIDFRGPGADGQPTGEPVRTYDITPKAGASDFDDSQWPAIAPASLTQRRGTGRICFNWYRIAITVPERVGDLDPTGSTLVFETAVDDYA